MEAKVSMLPVASSLRKFQVRESSTQFMIIASDKFEEQHHIIRIEKRGDVESLNFNLEDLIHEEVENYSKAGVERYLKDLKDTIGQKIGNTRQSVKKD